MSDTRDFTPGQLWRQLVQTTTRALQSGHLQPIATQSQLVQQGGVSWLLRVIESLTRKPNTATLARRVNPFLPYDPEMHVADLSPTHVCLLNKFNVVPHHLLIVTRQYESQDAALTRADFEALWMCMTEYDSLGFYNSGPAAGASQPHKHLQTVPLPLHAEAGDRIPLEPLLQLDRHAVGQVGCSSGLPFVHFVARLDLPSTADPQQAAIQSHRQYRQLISAAGWQEVGEQTPYNLLVTRQWMLLVPRRRESFQDISLNALAFAGALLAKNPQQMQQLLRADPLQVLAQVAFGL